MQRLRYVFLIFFAMHSVGIGWLLGQSPTSVFQADSEVCRNQTVEIDNQSTGANRYFWDFCLTDIAQTPDFYQLGIAGTISNLGAVEFVYDDEKWFGFAPGRGDNNLYRLDFSNGLQGGFTLTSLGSLSGSLNQPKNLRLIKENGEWMGLIVNVTNTIVRIRFPNGLTGQPVSENLGNLGALNAPIGLELVNDAGQWIALVSSYSAGLAVIRFGSSLLNNPGPADIFSFPVNPVSGSVGISVAKDQDGKWRGIIASYNTGLLYKIGFESGLLSAPSFSVIQPLSAPTETRMVVEGGEFYGFASSQSGQIMRVKFGNSLADNSQDIDLFSNLGGISNIDAFSVAKQKGTWHAFVADRNFGTIGMLRFESNCDFILSDTSTDFEPKGVNFLSPGSFWISLEAQNDLTLASTSFRNIQVLAQQSPEIAFTFDKICLESDIRFNSETSSAIAPIEFVWNFGNFLQSAAAAPLVSFPAAGAYEVKLQMKFQNACISRFAKTVEIYPPPDASFSVPAGLICTNNQFTFTNSTPDVFNGNLSYQWYVDNQLVTSQRNMQFMFQSGGDKQVKLITAIPGCSDQAVQTIPQVGEGPTVGFQVAGKCVGEQIAFTNQSSGSIVGFEWDLGGTLSTLPNPSIAFSAIGTYVTKLKATGTNGCVSETTKPLVIYSRPVAAFALALPPFSCSGSPAQFNDNTPPPTDSNLADWSWQFGSGSAGSTQKNPSFTYAQPGTYSVALTVTTDQGCSGKTEKPVTIQQSPTIDFTNTPACRNQATQFVSSSNIPVKSYLWNVGSNTYTVANPTHVFGGTGTQIVQLRIVAQNDCVTTLSRSLTIPIELNPDFVPTNLCAGQLVTFTNTTPAPTDPVQTVQWTINGQTLQGTSVKQQFAAAGTYPVTMQITAQSGCSYQVNRSVVIQPSPKADFSLSDDAGPAPFRVQFTNTSQGATAYLWRFNDGKGSTSTSVNPEFIFEALGDYGVDLIATNPANCSNQITRKVRVITPLPDLELLGFRVLPDPLTKLYVSQMDIRNNSNYTIREVPVLLNLGVGIALREVVREVWQPGSSKTVTLQNQVQPSKLFSFACAELAFVGDLQQANNKLCISLNESTVWLAAHPNPADQYVSVPLITSVKGQIVIRLVDAAGGIAYEKTVDQNAVGLREWTFPVGQLSPGIYTLVVQTADGTKSSRMLIKRQGF